MKKCCCWPSVVNRDNYYSTILKAVVISGIEPEEALKGQLDALDLKSSVKTIVVIWTAVEAAKSVETSIVVQFKGVSGKALVIC